MKLLLLLFDFLQKVLDAAALDVLIQFESGHKALAILTLNGDEGTDSFSMDDELVKGVFLVWVVALLASFISEEGTVEAEVLLKLRQCVILRLIIWAAGLTILCPRVYTYTPSWTSLCPTICKLSTDGPTVDLITSIATNGVIEGQAIADGALVSLVFLKVASM